LRLVYRDLILETIEIFLFLGNDAWLIKIKSKTLAAGIYNQPCISVL